MKIRSDFVTNSSSSSFIIGKREEDSVSIDSVYHIIRDLYKDYIKRLNRMISYVNKHPELHTAHDTSNVQYNSFVYTMEDNSSYREKWDVFDILEKKYGVSPFDTFAKSYEWTDLDTYEQYVDYWKRKREENQHIHAPFTIGDFFSEKEIEWVHYMPMEIPEFVSTTHEVNSTSDTLGWYFPYIEEAYRYPDTCDGCNNSEWCNKQKCKKTKKLVKEKNIPEDKACLYLMGRVCIHSESGYIPEFIVKRLRKISEFSCNHMG